MSKLQEIRRKHNLQGIAYIKDLENAIEDLETSLIQAKNDHKRIREMRKWDDYDQLNKKYLKKCVQLKQYEKGN